MTGGASRTVGLVGAAAFSPTIALNRIVAEAMVYGDELPRLEAVRGHLLERLARGDTAAEAYRRAIKATLNTAERAHLHARLRWLRQSSVDK